MSFFSSRSQDSRPLASSRSIGFSTRCPTTIQVPGSKNRSQKEHLDETHVSDTPPQPFPSRPCIRSSWHRRVPSVTCARHDGSRGPRRQVFEGRHYPRSRQTAFLDAHRLTRRRRDPRLHYRRQGILDHQRRAQPLLRPPGPGRHPQQSESHHGQRPRLFVPAHRNQQPAERRARSQNLRGTERRVRCRGEHRTARLCERRGSPGIRQRTRNAPHAKPPGKSTRSRPKLPSR